MTFRPGWRGRLKQTVSAMVSGCVGGGQAERENIPTTKTPMKQTAAKTIDLRSKGG
jgi:hypothetical protein